MAAIELWECVKADSADESRGEAFVVVAVVEVWFSGNGPAELECPRPECLIFRSKVGLVDTLAFLRAVSLEEELPSVAGVSDGEAFGTVCVIELLREAGRSAMMMGESSREAAAVGAMAG